MGGLKIFSSLLAKMLWQFGKSYYLCIHETVNDRFETSDHRHIGIRYILVTIYRE